MCEEPKCFSTIKRKARKGHICFECKEVIKSGDFYQYSSGIWDEPASYKQCLRCYRLCEKIIAENECFGFGFLIESFFEQVYQDRSIDQVLKNYTKKWSLSIGELDFVKKNKIME